MRKGKDLIFISQINRDGSGATRITDEREVEHLNEASFDLSTLSLTNETFIASGFNSFVVKLRAGKMHELKCFPQFFQPIVSGVKTFEVRLNDRNFKENDILQLREWDNVKEVYTSREIMVRVTYVLLPQDGLGIYSGYCIMGISKDKY
jgi:hypothetical protein